MDLVLKSLLSFSLLAGLAFASLPVYAQSFAANGETMQGHIKGPEDDSQKTGKRPKVAIVLGGGGLRSASGIGVLKALEDEGVPVDLVLGTGMGAVVGGLYCAGMTPEHIEEQFTKKKLMHAYLTIPLSLRILVIPLFYTPRLVGIEPYDGLYRGKKFAAYLDKQVPETQHQIEELKLPFAAVAVNLLDGQSKLLRSGSLSKVLQASCAIPALRKPVKMDDGLYVDGAVLNNLPVKEARQLGADIVVAVDVTEKIEDTVDGDYHKVGSVSHRVVNLCLAQSNKEARQLADYVIIPQTGHIGIISTSAADAKTCIEAGLRAGHQAAPAIRELIERH